MSDVILFMSCKVPHRETDFLFFVFPLFYVNSMGHHLLFLHRLNLREGKFVVGSDTHKSLLQSCLSCFS